MPPVLYLIRHGQGEHNVNNSHHLRDALLTDHGKEQCHKLRDTFPAHQDISLVLASPLRRAIQTAAFSFGPTLEERELPLLLVPMAQEISHLTCDLGQDLETLRSEVPKLVAQAAPGYGLENLDMSLVDSAWNSKRGIYAPTLPAVRRRAAELRSWLWKRPEKQIALVSHGAFLHYLTEDWATYDKARGTGYWNCEYRVFGFTNDSTEEEAHLSEVGSTRAKQDRPPGLDAHIIHEMEVIEAEQ